MKKLITISFTLFLILGFATKMNAQDVKATLVGTIVDSKTHQAVPYATIKIEGSSLGTTSDADGNYVINNIPQGNHKATVSFSGYMSETKSFYAEAGKRKHLDFYISEEDISLDQVVVTASRSTVLRRLAPSLVTVMPTTTMKNTNSQTLSQGLRFLPGLRIEDNCQNCGFNQVRINGLEGPYSQVLIDSRPIMSALSGVYGLEQIPSSMIERVEVIRGGGSALYGSNAVGGVINVITKEPVRNTASVDYTMTALSPSKNSFSRFENNININGSVVSDDRSAGITLFGQYHFRPGLDYDGDSFTDVPNLRNRALGFNSYYKPTLNSKIKLEFHSSHEHRRGGNDLDRPPFSSDIAEYLRHFNNGGSLSYNIFSEDKAHQFEAYLAGQSIERISYYGGGDATNFIDRDYNDEYKAKLKLEPSEIDNLVDDLSNLKGAINKYGLTRDLTFQCGAQYIYHFAKAFDLTLGAEGNYDRLSDRSPYRENAIAQKTKTISQYHQLEYKVEDFTVLFGGRLDYATVWQGDNETFKKPIYSPRFNIRYNPLKNTSIRASYSAGFRAPQAFDEDLHVDLLGNNTVTRVLSENLQEEKSHSVSLSVDHYGNIGEDWSYNLMAEGFYTKLVDKFGTDDSQDNKRIVINVKDGAKVYGVNFEARLAYKRLFDLQFGYTWQRSMYGTPTDVSDVSLRDANGTILYEKDDNDNFVTDADGNKTALSLMSKDFMRTPNNYGYFVATVRPTDHLSFNLSGTFTGSMKVPHAAYEDAPATFNADVDTKVVKFAKVLDGQKYRGVGVGGFLETTKSFADIDLKANYEIHLSAGSTLTLKAGVQNIFDAFQQDTDQGPGRASAYIYGPMLPRRVFAGLSFSI